MNFYNGDCLEVLKAIPDESIDLILADPPYGTTECSWDVIIPLEPLWLELKRVRKTACPVVLFGGDPFTSILILSNIKEFKYKLIWNKIRNANFMQAKKRPLKNYEDLVVFYKTQCTYNPQMILLKKPYKHINRGCYSELYNYDKPHFDYPDYRHHTHSYPTSILEYSCDNTSKANKHHPTQKPVALLEYLIKTYSNRGDTVMDFCMGSGSTGVACKRLYREFIGIEKDKKYYELAINRINDFKRGFGVES